MVDNINQNKNLNQEVWSLYLYALKSSMIREKLNKVGKVLWFSMVRRLNGRTKERVF